jgi:hypothetical protein
VGETKTLVFELFDVRLTAALITLYRRQPTPDFCSFFTLSAYWLSGAVFLACGWRAVPVCLSVQLYVTNISKLYQVQLW